MEGKGVNSVVWDVFSQRQESETELDMRALKQDI